MSGLMNGAHLLFYVAAFLSVWLTYRFEVWRRGPKQK